MKYVEKKLLGIAFTAIMFLFTFLLSSGTVMAAEAKPLTPGEIAAQNELAAQVAAAQAQLAQQVAAAQAQTTTPAVEATQTAQTSSYIFPNNAVSSISLVLYPNEDSNKNARHACDILNGQVITKGTVFSYNSAIGQRNKATGFVKAPVVNGYDYGGGICKISTALYNLALDSGAKVTERHAHSHAVPYVAHGKDATVSWGTKDLRFITNENVQIVAVYDNSGYHISFIPIS